MRAQVVLSVPHLPSRAVPLTGDRYSLGRAATNDFAFPDDVGLSRFHLHLQREGGQWTVIDLGSTNGTQFNGERLLRKQVLAEGDQIAASQVTLRFELIPASEETAVQFDAIDAPFSYTTSLKALQEREQAHSTQLRRAWTSPVTMLIRIGKELERRRPMPELLHAMLDLAIEAMDGDRGALVLRQPDGSLSVAAARGEAIRISTAVRDQVLQKATSVLIADTSDPFARATDTIVQQLVRSLVAVPLQTDEAVLGVLYVDIITPGRAFSEPKLELLTAIANVAAQRIERERFAERLEQLAYRDPLTSLPNRALFVDLVGRAMQQQERFSVLLLWLDRFNVVRNSLGNEVANHLLLLLSQRVRACLEPNDVLSRLANDQFALLVAGADGDAQTTERLAQIQQVLEVPFAVTERQVFVTASIGVVDSQGQYTEPEDLLRDAEIAAHRARISGGGRHCVFEGTMHQGLVRQQQMESDLRRALMRNEELRLVYQPIVSLDDRRIKGFEVLVRWTNGPAGPISPAEFIPMAEETGLIVALGRTVLREACRQLATWRSALPEWSDLYVSVNVSPRQLADSTFSGMLQTAIDHSGIDPRALCLEITESAVMEDQEQAATLLAQLRQLGVLLALDDFGTGYSSLSYLSGLPLDILKVDRSFVRAMRTSEENMHIVRMIGELGQALKLKIVAEGLESEIDVDLVRALNYDLGQGYFFGAPLSVADATRLLEEAAGPEQAARRCR